MSVTWVASQAIDPTKLPSNTRGYVETKIKTLLKKFAKGINSIEIASIEDEERTATKLIIDIEI